MASTQQGSNPNADPLAGYNPNVDPLAGYDPGQAPPTGFWHPLTPAPSDPTFTTSSALGQTGLLDKPANVSMRDWLAAKYAEAGSGIGQLNQTGEDYFRVASNAFGVGDKLNSWSNGTTLAQEQQKTQEARDRLGPAATFAANMTGFGPLKALGVGAKLDAAGRPMLASATDFGIGSAVQGAATTPSDDTWLQTLGRIGAYGTGGFLGGGTLGAGAKYALNPIANWTANAAGRATGALAKPTAITDALQANRDAAYDALKDAPLDPADTRQALQGIRDGISAIDPTGGLLKNAPRSSAVLDNLQKHAAESDDISAHDLLSLGLDKLPPPAGGEAEIAPLIKTGINNYLDSTPAAGMVQDAKDAHRLFANARDLQGMTQNMKAWGTSPAGQAQQIATQYYPDQAAKWFENPSDPAAAQFAALQKISRAAGGSAISPYGATHALAPLIDMATAGAGGLVGGPAGAVIGEHAGNLLNYGVVKPAAGAALGYMTKKASQNAINAGYPALTGQAVRFPPINMMSPVVRQLIWGSMPKPSN